MRKAFIQGLSARVDNYISDTKNIKNELRRRKRRKRSALERNKKPFYSPENPKAVKGFYSDRVCSFGMHLPGINTRLLQLHIPLVHG